MHRRQLQFKPAATIEKVPPFFSTAAVLSPSHSEKPGQHWQRDVKSQLPTLPNNRTFLSICINLWHSTNQGAIANRKENNMMQQEALSNIIKQYPMLCVQMCLPKLSQWWILVYMLDHVGTSYHMLPQGATWYHMVPWCHQGFCAMPLALRGYRSPLLCVARVLQESFHDEEEPENAINLNAQASFFWQLITSLITFLAQNMGRNCVQHAKLNKHQTASTNVSTSRIKTSNMCKCSGYSVTNESEYIMVKLRLTPAQGIKFGMIWHAYQAPRCEYRKALLQTFTSFSPIPCLHMWH